jgi:hypothetical protein
MTDANQSADGTPIVLAPDTAGVHDEHWCEHPGCKAWGSFGYAVKSETGWYCGAHREKRFER